MFRPSPLYLIRSVTYRGQNRTCHKIGKMERNSFEEDFRKFHIPINTFQQTLLTIGAASLALLDPYRADMVACLGETTGSFALHYILSQMENSQEAAKILKEKPRINSSTVDLNKLRKMPEGTLGRVYANFLDENKVTPDTRDPVRFVSDIKLAYVMQRYREIHDLIHALLGMKTNMLGEVTVKWVEAIQTKLPMCVGGAIFGPLRLKPKQRKDYLQYYLPWAIETGSTSKFFMNVYFEERWEQPIVELHEELNIKPLILSRFLFNYG
ncbi:hypothetical protein HHI36_019045 [Cryptolaemus montrouzieri]